MPFGRFPSSSWNASPEPQDSPNTYAPGFVDGLLGIPRQWPGVGGVILKPESAIPGFEGRRAVKRRQEIEIKLEVRDPVAIKRRLRELGFRRVRARHFESNRLFDFPDLALRRTLCMLRLRFASGKALLTFKGAPVYSRRYKVRPELETEVAGGKLLAEILKSAGFEEVFRYDRYRTEYVPGPRRSKKGPKSGNARGEVDYDETPIGNYIELEGPKRWIDRTAQELGFGRQDYITLSYAALYHQKCREAGRKPGVMVFPAERRLDAGSSRRRRRRELKPARQ
jgi:adenylate cyclase, class 2